MNWNYEAHSQISAHEGLSKIALKEMSFCIELCYSEQPLLTKQNCTSLLVSLDSGIMFQDLIIQVQTI